jgi:hypothetical protein
VYSRELAAGVKPIPRFCQKNFPAKSSVPVTFTVFLTRAKM